MNYLILRRCLFTTHMSSNFYSVLRVTFVLTTQTIQQNAIFANCLFYEGLHCKITTTKENFLFFRLFACLFVCLFIVMLKRLVYYFFELKIIFSNIYNTNLQTYTTRLDFFCCNTYIIYSIQNALIVFRVIYKTTTT